jgi:cytoplasmic iron level regulating protein YaaA (DUF328/UPF0246 family)
VRLLLPPSETKHAPTRGRSLDLAELFAPELTTARESVLDDAADAAAREDAAAIFGVSESLMPQVLRNAALRTAPTAPAARIYTGVLYDALGYDALAPDAKRRAHAHVLIFSAVFGAVSLADRIPAYRASGGTKLPAHAGRALNAWWRPRLAETLEAWCDGHLVVDSRSGAYASMFTPASAQRVTLDVLQRRNGKLTVVSHFAKHTRGEVTRKILEAGSEVMRLATPHGLAEWASREWEVDLHETAGKPASLRIILS